MIFKPLTNDFEWEWVIKRACPMPVYDSQGIVAYDERSGKIAGVVVMDSWTQSGCQAHIAIENPFCIRSGLLHEVARHVHIACGRRYIFGLVPANNEKALRFDQKIGFTEVARVPDGYAEGVDYVVMRLSKDDNMWLEENREVA